MKYIHISLKSNSEMHAKIFFERTQDEAVRKGMHALANTKEEAIENYYQQAKDNSYYRRCIYVDECYIGDVWCSNIHCFTTIDGLLSLCIFDKEYWNKGIASEALALFLVELKQQFDLHDVGALLYAKNIGSKKVCEKLGFALVKTFKEHEQDAYYFKKHL